MRPLLGQGAIFRIPILLVEVEGGKDVWGHPSRSLKRWRNWCTALLSSSRIIPSLSITIDGSFVKVNEMKLLPPSI